MYLVPGSVPGPGGAPGPGGGGVPGPGGWGCTWSQGVVYLVSGGGVPGPGAVPAKVPPCGQTHACEHITLPQTSFAGGKNALFNEHANRIIMVYSHCQTP